MSRQNRRIFYELCITLLLLGTAGCSSVIDDEEQVTEHLRVGDRVPLFSVSVVDGGGSGIFSTRELVGETVIVFFNTWCKDCERELPVLNDYYLRHKNDRGFQMVAISRAEGEESVSAFWRERGLEIPYSAQNDRRIYNLFATRVIPRVYFVSAEGIVTRIDVEHFEVTP